MEEGLTDGLGDPARRRNWPALDGLRGIAVLAVLFFHVHAPGAANGYVGVDVFFALSGFLITYLLIHERRTTGAVSLGRFYARRALRLLPALVATLLGVCVLASITGDLNTVGPGALAALLYVANWWIYLGGGAPLLEHTWTLAIEEHFYLVWPLLVLALGSASRRLRSVGWTGLTVVVVLFVLPWPDLIAPVKLSYERGIPIVWGSLLALAVATPRLAGRVRVLGWAGAVALVALLALIADLGHLPSRWLEGVTSVPGVLSVIIVAMIVTRPNARTARVLEITPLRWAGKRAYGIYLYHFPISSLLINHVAVEWPSGAVAAVATVLSLVVACLSYRYLEQPFLRLKDRFASTPVSDGASQLTVG